MKKTIKEEIDTNLKDFALYTIYNRAIPSAIDGFKPGHRKILYAMLQYPNPTRNKVKLADLGSISCVAGDTLVVVDGSETSVENVVSNFSAGSVIQTFNQKTKTFEKSQLLAAWKTKDADTIIEIELVSGDIMKLTPEHRVLTTNGWKMAISLTAEDVIISEG